MRVAGHRPRGGVRHDVAPPRVFEFTVERVTTGLALDGVASWDQTSARVKFNASAGRDCTATVRAATAAEAIEAFADAFGDDRGAVTLSKGYTGESVAIGRVEYRIMGDFRQVSP